MNATNSGSRKEKIVMLGPPGSGKTAIANRIVSDAFRTNTVATVGAAFLTKVVQIDGISLRLDIWDTGGSEKYRALAPMYYREARAAILVFDVTNPGSREAACGWIKELREHARKDILIAGAGNKIDLDDERSVSTEDVEKFGQEQQLDYCVEVSAKTGANIEKLVEAVCQALAKMPVSRTPENDVAPEYITGTEENKCGC
jgi:small GTP-binding protein